MQTTNKLIPIIAIIAVAIVSFVGWKAYRTDDGPVTANKPMRSIPRAEAASSPQQKPGIFGATKAADGDKPNETLRTLVARFDENDKKLQQVLDENRQLRNDNAKLKGGSGGQEHGAPAPATGPVGTPPLVSQTPSGTAPVVPGLNEHIDSVISKLNGEKPPQQPKAAPGQAATSPSGMPAGLGFDGLGSGLGQSFGAGPGAGSAAIPAGAVDASPRYTVIAPQGYVASKKTKPDGSPGGFVRASLGDADSERETSAPSSSQAAATKAVPEPYFTIPENGTLTRVTAMTALVGRVPIDGRVQDPMQFKAIVGRENLAANGIDIPDDISGIVVTGVAIGDMAMSCTEAHVHSLTFVFEDGSIRTVSQRKSASGAAAASTRDKSLGFMSDRWGNPCIAGKFITNAPSYLTDIALFKGLTIGSRAYAAAQTTTTDSNYTGTSSSAVTGSRGAFVLGQMAAGSADEVSNWVFSRLKSSFDAVVVPAGARELVLHIDQEIAIDKAVNPRRLDHRRAGQQHAAGAHHGLE